MAKQKKELIILLIIFITSLFALGWITNELYEDINYKKSLEGFYARNFNYTEVTDYIDDRDKYGNWVCVNIKGMSYERSLEVIQHEVGHEIFAGECEKNMTKCMERMLG